MFHLLIVKVLIDKLIQFLTKTDKILVGLLKTDYKLKSKLIDITQEVFFIYNSLALNVLNLLLNFTSRFTDPNFSKTSKFMLDSVVNIFNSYLDSKKYNRLNNRSFMYSPISKINSRFRESLRKHISPLPDEFVKNRDDMTQDYKKRLKEYESQDLLKNIEMRMLNKGLRLPKPILKKIYYICDSVVLKNRKQKISLNQKFASEGNALQHKHEPDYTQILINTKTNSNSSTRNLSDFLNNLYPISLQLKSSLKHLIYQIYYSANVYFYILVLLFIDACLTDDEPL